MRRDQNGERDGSPDPRWSLFESKLNDGGTHADGAGGQGGDGSADPLLAAVAAELRQPVLLDEGLDERVMALVAAEVGPRRETTGEWKVVPHGRAAGATTGPLVRAWRWLRRPRLVSISPLGGLAAAAGMAALILVVGHDADGVGGDAAGASLAAAPSVVRASEQPAAGVGDTLRIVQFVLVAPGARSVAVVGDFNDWQEGITPLRASAAGRVWSVEVPLRTGRHRYAFVVDGEEWVPDPTAPRAPGDDFGVPSSVVTVAERRS